MIFRNLNTKIIPGVDQYYLPNQTSKVYSNFLSLLYIVNTSDSSLKHYKITCCYKYLIIVESAGYRY